MKKYIVIALAALVAFAACTKVNPEEKKSEKISFQVANYMAQTKANSSLESEGYETFNCYAWQFTAAGVAANTIPYMSNIAVNKGTNEWVPSDDYYWPKTGYINFYSYAGSQAPTVTPSDGNKTVTVAYTNKTIASTDNFMVADPALHFGVANFDADMVKINDNQGAFDYTTGNYTYTAINPADTDANPLYKGVPTLFHHMLAKVAFVIKLKTTTASNNTSWTVKVLNSATDNQKSNIEALKTGTLTLESADAAAATASASIGSWTVKNATNAAIGWVPGTSAEVMPFETVSLTLPKEATETAAQTLLPVRTVMPQATSSVAFNLAYEVSAAHGSTVFMKEVIKVSEQLSAIASTPAAWNMNQITLYTITIDPVGKKITFDPAVVEWTSQAATEIKL